MAVLTRRPRKGDTVRFHKGPRDHRLEDLVFTVLEAKDDGICWMQAEGQKPTCFIWRFNRTGELNLLAEIV